MIQSFLEATGIWAWWIIGMILIGIEVLAPGTFFLWFGLAAFAVGALTMVFGLDSTFWTWQPQIITFVVLALVFAVIGRQVMKNRSWDRSDRPDMNERGVQLIGSHAVVSQALSGGTGRVRVGDTTWRATGPDLPEGTRVRIVSASASTLGVEASGDE